jgi:hypothetical protein
VLSLYVVIQELQNSDDPEQVLQSPVQGRHSKVKSSAKEPEGQVLWQLLLKR